MLVWAETGNAAASNEAAAMNVNGFVFMFVLLFDSALVRAAGDQYSMKYS
jgi:hypothetical protein